MKKLVLLGLGMILATTVFAQQLRKLKIEDLTLVRGNVLGTKPCGASSPTPEEDLENGFNHVRDIDRTKWLGYLHRAKNVLAGYDKWWACITISLADSRRIVIDGSGFICLLTKDPKVFFFYQLEKKDFEDICKVWNQIKATEK
jgi:hypothetical protein